MRRLKSSLLLALVAILALVQTSAQNVSDAVYRVGSRLACLCGCAHTVATCDMFECGFSKPAKEKIARLVKAGVSDQAIIDEFIKENGPQIYRAEPNAFGWVVPYASVLVGLAAIWLVIRKYRKPRPLPEAGPAAGLEEQELAKYTQQIEKDLSHLD